MEQRVNLKDWLFALRKHMRLIVGITVVSVLAAGLASFYLITPVYEASTQILVNQKKRDDTGFQYNEVQANIQLVNTYNVIIQSPAILERVVSRLNLEASSAQLRERVQVVNEKNSQVISITVQDPDPAQARDIANEVAAVFQEQIVSIMSVDNVTILSAATEADAPVEPRPLLNIAAAFAIGLLAAVALATLLEYLNNTIDKEQDIEAVLGLPVLGVVTEMEAAGTDKKKRR